MKKQIILLLILICSLSIVNLKAATRKYISRYISYTPNSSIDGFDYHTFDYLENNYLYSSGASNSVNVGITANQFILAVGDDNSTIPTTSFRFVNNQVPDLLETVYQRFLPGLFLTHSETYVAWGFTPLVTCASSIGSVQAYRINIKFFTCLDAAQSFYNSISGVKKIISRNVLAAGQKRFAYDFTLPVPDQSSGEVNDIEADNLFTASKLSNCICSNLEDINQSCSASLSNCSNPSIGPFCEKSCCIFCQNNACGGG